MLSSNGLRDPGVTGSVVDQRRRQAAPLLVVEGATSRESDVVMLAVQGLVSGQIAERVDNF